MMYTIESMPNIICYSYYHGRSSAARWSWCSGWNWGTITCYYTPTISTAMSNVGLRKSRVVRKIMGSWGRTCYIHSIATASSKGDSWQNFIIIRIIGSWGWTYTLSFVVWWRRGFITTLHQIECCHNHSTSDQEQKCKLLALSSPTTGFNYKYYV